MWERIGVWLDWILRITGALSIFWQIVKYFLPKSEYLDNIIIKQIKNYEEAMKLELHMVYSYRESSGLGGEFFVIFPNNADIKKLKIIAVDFNGKKLVNTKVLKVFKNIKNTQGLVIETFVPETIPRMKIEWDMGKGLKGEYLFQYNGFNGNTNIRSYKYDNNLLRVISNILC